MKYRRTGCAGEGGNGGRSRQGKAGLRPWPEVVRLYNEKSGEKLKRSRVWQIARQAERKIQQALGNWRK